jgi:hypothetical protein
MRVLLISAALAAFSLPACVAAGTAAEADDVNVPDVIRKFAAKEAEFQAARNNYTYRQTVNLTETDTGGKWDLIEDIIFTPEGKRISKVIYAPVQSLRQIILTPDDERDLRDVQPFVLTTTEIPNYDITYISREKVDEVSCFLFNVKPKKLVKDKRYFEGQIWVDDRDLQIVKTFGKGVGVRKGDDAFPRFETYREQIDGKYWFPTYTRADDTLHFKTSSVHIKMVVKYQDYKKYEGRSTIKFGDVVDDSKKDSTTPPTKKK